MNKSFAIAIGAGLASALLFVASARGTGLALVMTCVTPLPIMIATMGFGHTTGLVGAIVAALAAGVVLGPLPAVSYTVLLGFPAWWLAYLALLARPAPAGAPPDAKLWYPIGRIVAWSAALSAAAVLAFGVVLLLRYGGFSAAQTALGHRLEAALTDTAESLPADPAGAATARRIVTLLPAVMAASTFTMLSVNLWISGRVVQQSALLSRPWPALPENLRLPRWAAYLAVAASLTALLGGAATAAGGVVAASFGAAFVFQGLGAAHALTRGLAMRRLILFSIYFITLAVAPSLLGLAAIGVLDCLLSLRGRRWKTPPTPST